MSDVPYIQLDPYLMGVQALLFGLQEAGLIPDLDPLNYLIGAFDGKPKLEDTELAALRLQSSPWWPLKALGTNLQIWVKNGVPLSTGNLTYRAQLSEWIRGTIDSLEPIVFGRLDPGTLDHAIWLSMTSQDGDTAIVQLNNTIAEQHALGPLPALPGITPQTPPGVVPGTGPNNILLTTDGDELNDLQRTIIFQNSLIYQALLNLGGALNNPGNDQCCTNVVQAISNVVGQLSIIAAAISSAGSTQVNIDLTPLTTEIAALVGAVGAYPPVLQACCAAVNNSLGGIRDAITNAGGTDTKPIVDAVNAFAKIVDIKPATIDYLVKQGFLDPQLVQVIQSADFGDHILGALRTMGWTAINWVWKAVANFKPNVPFLFGGLTESIAAGLSDTIGVALSIGAAPLFPEIKGIIDGVVTVLKPTALPTIGNVNVDPDLLISKTLAPVLIINAVTLIFDYFGWEISEQLKEYVDVAAELVGLQEIRELKVGQMMRFGPMREAELRAKATYRQEIVGLSTMASWSARGLYDPARTRGLAPVTGAPIEQVQPMMLAAYRGLNARQMLRLIETNLFTQAEINDELTFGGMRPVSQTRMLHAAPYLATNPQRNQLIGTLEKAHIQGLMDDATLASNIDSAEANVDRNNLILQRNHWEILIQETKDLESEYTTLYLAQAIDDPTFRGFLGGIGLQPWKANTVAAKAEARLAATLNRKAIAEALALQKATATVEREAALKNYEEGVTPLPLYTAALLATGLTATQAAAWSDLAVLKKAGNARWTYGLQLTPAAATQLKERVTALTDQRKRQLISQAQYTQALQALGIGNTWINALDAAAEATLTPKIAAFAVPVSTT